MGQVILQYDTFIVYVLAVLWVTWTLHMIPRGVPTSLDPEPRPSIWQMTEWYVLLVVLFVIGVLVFRSCEGHA